MMQDGCQSISGKTIQFVHQQALPATAEIGGETHQTPNPSFRAASLKVHRNARSCPMHAVLAVLSLPK